MFTKASLVLIVGLADSYPDEPAFTASCASSGCNRIQGCRDGRPCDSRWEAGFTRWQRCAFRDCPGSAGRIREGWLAIRNSFFLPF
jgi:hypothetical protein